MITMIKVGPEWRDWRCYGDTQLSITAVDPDGTRKVVNDYIILGHQQKPGYNRDESRVHDAGSFETEAAGGVLNPIVRRSAKDGTRRSRVHGTFRNRPRFGTFLAQHERNPFRNYRSGLWI